jgi:hypothetical protein
LEKYESVETSDKPDRKYNEAENKAALKPMETI